MTHFQRLSLSGNQKLLSAPSLLWLYPTPVLLNYFRRNMAAAETCVLLDWNNFKLGDFMPKKVASFSNLVSLRVVQKRHRVALDASVHIILRHRLLVQDAVESRKHAVSQTRNGAVVFLRWQNQKNRVDYFGCFL